MELFLTEAKARQLWDDETLGMLMQGCKYVTVLVTATSGLKYLAIAPTSIAFDDWGIDLSEDLSRSLATVADIVVLSKEAE